MSAQTLLVAAPQGINVDCEFADAVKPALIKIVGNVLGLGYTLAIPVALVLIVGLILMANSNIRRTIIGHLGYILLGLVVLGLIPVIIGIFGDGKGC